jgi:hypothetical protein
MKSSNVSRKFSRSIEEPDISIPVLAPKYLSVDQVRAVYGITRGVLYALLKDRRVESVCVISRDGDGALRSRGKRLINVASLDAYLGQLAAEQEPLTV